MVPAQTYMCGTQPIATRPQSPLSGNLPRLSSVVGHAPPIPTGISGSPTNTRPYAPRSAEDRRVLNTFRLAF